MTTHDWDERGILTSADKEYLHGVADIAEGTEYNTRRRIRSRALLGIADFSTLFHGLSDADREMMFDAPKHSPAERIVGISEEGPSLHGVADLEEAEKQISKEEAPDDRLLAGIRDAIALFYLGLQDYDEGESEELFENLIRSGVKKAIERDGSLATVDVSVDATRYDESQQEIREKFLSGDKPLTEEEKHALIESDPEVLLELMKETLGSDDEDS